MEFRQKVADVAIKIFSTHCKVLWVDSSDRFDKTGNAKLSKIVTLIMHHSNIVLQSIKLIDMIKEVNDCEPLQDDQPFMYLFDYSLKQSVVAYQALIDYSQMFIEFDEDRSSYQFAMKVFDSIKLVQPSISEYHSMISLYGYMIEGASGVAENVQYSHRRVAEISESLEKMLRNVQYDDEGEAENLEEEKQPKTTTLYTEMDTGTSIMRYQQDTIL